MPASLGLITRAWSSVKERIVQPVPQNLEFCEFYCPLQQCTIEISGRCEMRPRATLILIKSSVSRPQWNGPQSDGPTTPAPAPTTPAHAA